MTARAIELLKIFNLDDRADDYARNLPYGDQRRLEILRAMATEPKLILLDEPAAGMNPAEKVELARSIEHIRSAFGLTVLLIEHDMTLVMDVCQGNNRDIRPFRSKVLPWPFSGSLFVRMESRKSPRWPRP